MRPRAELQTLLGISKSVGLVPCPTPQQLLSLTELVVDEKEREKRILRKALSMETRSPSEDISPECVAPNVMMIPPPYPGEKSFLRTPEDEKVKKSERRPSFRQQKSTEAMEKIEEDVQIKNIISKKLPVEKRKSIFRQMSLDSKQLSFDKSRDISPEEIAMVVQERRPPHLRELRSKTQDVSTADETPLSSQRKQIKESRSPMKRQLTAPVPDMNRSKMQKKPSLVRQDRQEIISTESLTKADDKDDLQLSVLERRSSLLRKSIQSNDTHSHDDTAETSLVAPEKIVISSPVETGDQSETWERRAPFIKDSKLFGASMETTSTSSNSTNITNLRSDSVVSEDTEKDAKNESEVLKKDDASQSDSKILVESREKIGSEERLIGTSSEECGNTSEEDVCQKQDVH